jgi:hypothetical protein
MSTYTSILEVFIGLEMWKWSDGARSNNYPVAPIPDSQVKEQTFIFIGRLQPANAIHVGMILNDFNRLLPLYEFVEGVATFPAQAPESQRKGFVWSPGNKARVTATTFERSAQTVEKLLRHNQIQSALFEHLRSICPISRLHKFAIGIRVLLRADMSVKSSYRFSAHGTSNH